jgi:hypothetical protein
MAVSARCRSRASAGDTPACSTVAASAMNSQLVGLENRDDRVALLVEDLGQAQAGLAQRCPPNPGTRYTSGAGLGWSHSV